MKYQNIIAISALLGSLSIPENVNALEAKYEEEDLNELIQEDQDSDDDIDQAYELLQSEVQDLNNLAQKVAKRAKKIKAKAKKFGPKAKKTLSKGQKALLKQKKKEAKLQAMAKKIKKVTETDKLIETAKLNAQLKKQKIAAKKAALKKAKADKIAAQKAEKKRLLEWKKAKVFGLPLPELPKINKAPLIPKALPPNPKNEAKKDEVERQADALIRKLNLEAEAKNEAIKKAEKQAAKEAATYRVARANRERREQQLKDLGQSPHTEDETWAFNMPEGLLKGYFQVASQQLLETNDEEDDFDDVDSSESEDE